MHGDTLRHAFLANGLFSLVSGLIFLIDGPALAGWIGLSDGLALQIVGAGLLPFGATLAWLSRRRDLTPRIGQVVSIMDAQWVVGTFVLLVGWPDLLNPTGRAGAVGIALVVTAFALWQIQGTRKLATAA